jgi:hypothetical protein
VLVSILEVISEGALEEIVLLGDVGDQSLDVFESEIFNVLIIEINASGFSVL